MNIKQDTVTGAMLIELSYDELCDSNELGSVFDIDEYVIALSDFVNSQAIETLRHTKECKIILDRIDELEERINQLNGNNQ